MKKSLKKAIAFLTVCILVFGLTVAAHAYARYYDVPYSTYDAFREAVLSRPDLYPDDPGYDVDGAYGYQCWDGAAVLFQQLGMNLYTAHSYYGDGYSSGVFSCWYYEAIRFANAGDAFDLIDDVTQVRRGDLIVFNGTSRVPTGHIGFADEDYVEGIDEIAVLGQNQVTGSGSGQDHFTVAMCSLDNFLGAFRYTGWDPEYIDICMVESMGRNVTSHFAGKEVRLKSIESGNYVCGEHDSILHAGDENSAGVYTTYQTNDGWIGFKQKDGKWFSVQDGEYVMSTGEDLLAWECFRIYSYNGDLYLLSQKNGCYIQVTDEPSRPLKAVRPTSDGLYGATWERFEIEVLGNSSGQGYANSTTSTEGFSTSQHYWHSDYIEGWYEGDWNGSPNGYGKLTYDDFEDGAYYALYFTDGSQCKALSYEGRFENGMRSGEGTVIYEGGWKDQGVYYGQWEPNKVVFEGKRWYGDSGYWPVTTISTSSTAATETFGEWTPANTAFELNAD